MTLTIQRKGFAFTGPSLVCAGELTTVVQGAAMPSPNWHNAVTVLIVGVETIMVLVDGGCVMVAVVERVTEETEVETEV